ncbi:SMI1/KNR4 family protein [Streptomyces sp. TRM43335]|uniref:SMI1/KNR4 family protein n=1 Tax=Streptomyces taklimakanensis TaxID=2569853 RepID=A0A6G2BA78_9ACTN|nr:SMI1/KNR4 family protein [Streptomyces taklimakanensis]MTE18979.1 SMI1/KNR4 family protein [Streptomyces taklimakanensis]
MDEHEDLIGAQTPKHRITDPDEALAALERAVPELAAHRRPEPAVIDWAVLEDGLGTALPADYKRLAEWYPVFHIGDFLLVGTPVPGKEHHRLRGIRDDLDGVLQDWWEADMSVGLRPYPAPGGLLPWAYSNEGDTFLWNTVGSDPDRWRVTVASRNGGWWHYEGGALQFLAEYCDGTLEPWELPGIRLDVTVRS